MPKTPDSKSSSAGPYDLSKTPLHLAAASSGPVIALQDFAFDGASFEQYIAECCSTDAPGRLLFIESSPTSWKFWECHPAGDEVVIILEGKAVFIQQIDDQEKRSEVGPGSTVVNPAGVWHTADVEVPIKAIYITPCPGTQHRTR